jgi:hypothetical protein
MGFFNMLEMFFFASLAITFVLILFLVYHFRQKFTALEEKCDTMFEIINNIVKEMNNRATLEQIQHEMPENVIFTPNVNQMNIPTELPKLVVSESEEEESDEESDEESEDEESDEESDEGFDDGTDQAVILPEELIEEEQSIKVIQNVDLNDIDEDINPIEDNNLSNEVSDIEDPDIDEGLDEEAVSMIHVEKLEETTLENNDETIETPPMEVYRKMNISALKALIVEKGLHSNNDINKMKKAELLRLLETSA